MRAGISSLPIRASPTRRSILRGAAHIASTQTPASIYTHGQVSQTTADTMFSRANKDYEAKGPQPPPRGNAALAKQLFPSSSPSASPSLDIRDQFKKSSPSSFGASSHFAAQGSARTNSSTNPLHSRSLNATSAAAGSGAPKGSLVSLYNKSSSFTKEPEVVDLTGPQGPSKIHEAVFFDERDFSDDDNLDLDYEAPSTMPSLPPAKENMPPPSQPRLSETAIPWSSSPLSHFQPPQPQRTISTTSSTSNSTLKRESSGDMDMSQEPAVKKPKKRVLPASFRNEDERPDPGILKTPVAGKSRDFWDPTASAIQEQKRQWKNQRQPRKEEAKPTDWQQDEVEEIIGSHAAKAAITLSQEQLKVVELVVQKNRSVFFTGPAGTGKSVLMRAIIADLKKKYAKDPERVAVTASTGLAACNISGMTLHSFSGIGLGKEDAATLVRKIKRNQKAKNRWLRTKCLIIDEISMVDGDLFDKLDHIGRVIRNNGRPWGGIQLVITGDFFQLPPVPDSGEKGEKREAKFAFDAATWNTSIDHTIGLTQVFRQRDPQFARMLNEMRLGKITDETERAFKALARPLTFDDGVDLAELFPTRLQVEQSNERRLRELPGKTQRYEALDSGDPAIRDKLLVNMMAPKSLDLKINAQVMLIKNLDESLVNGSLGKVIAFSDEKTFDLTDGEGNLIDPDDPLAKAKRKLSAFKSDPDKDADGQQYPVVQFMSTTGAPRVILCQPEEWRVELPNGEVQAKRTQLPLILAWALSIHKAQGQTLERVTVNLGKVFERGQAYVALSRATCQDGLRVIGFNKSKVMAHPRVVTFYSQLYTADQAAKRRPTKVSDFVADRKGLPMFKPKPAAQVISLDDDEEAMASYGY